MVACVFIRNLRTIKKKKDLLNMISALLIDYIQKEISLINMPSSVSISHRRNKIELQLKLRHTCITKDLNLFKLLRIRTEARHHCILQADKSD